MAALCYSPAFARSARGLQRSAESISYRISGIDTCQLFGSERRSDRTVHTSVGTTCQRSSTHCEVQSSDKQATASGSGPGSGPGPDAGSVSGSGSGSSRVHSSPTPASPGGVFLKKGVIPLLTFGVDGQLKLDTDPDRTAPGNSENSENSENYEGSQKSRNSARTSTSGRPDTKKKTTPMAPAVAAAAANVPKWKLPALSGRQKEELQKSGGAPKYSKAQRRFFNENFRETERLSKVLASVGVASRRASEAVIFAGRVTVNGQLCTLPQTGVDLGRDVIEVDGQPIPRKLPPRICFVVNKPKGYICTSTPDGGGTKLALDLVDKYMAVWVDRNRSLPKPRLFTVGRLDVATTGLLIITNDGDLAQKVGHPSSGLTKEYIASVDEKVTRRQLALMSAGTVVDGVHCIPAQVELMPQEMGDYKTRIKIVVNEGRNHEVRNIVANSGLEVKALKRVRIGGLRLSRKLNAGKFEVMVPSHLEKLLFGTTETLV